MTVLLLSASLFLVSIAAGLLGALTGLGGGVVLVPALVLLFGVDIHYAMGASLLSVIATSSGAAAAFFREGYTNLRIGMFLELAAVLGAIGGAYAAALLNAHVIAIMFGIILLGSAYFALRRHDESDPSRPSHPWAVRLGLEGTYGAGRSARAYRVYNVPVGFALMGAAGVLSGLLGIGSGAVKVIAMDQAMRLPYKVSTATSNFIIGITAAASAGVYFGRGYIDPGLTMPVMLGVLVGAVVGARIMTGARSGMLRFIFSIVIVALGVQMIVSGVRGGP
ncbi:MAG: sulfite exporter TauE/SafE family protein [Myxococcota bacterium]